MGKRIPKGTPVTPKTGNSLKQSKPWQFKQGQSGNPAGRPRIALDARERIKEWVMGEGLEKGLAIAADSEHPKQWEAVRFYTELVTGKAAQEITGKDGGPVLVLQDVVSAAKKFLP